MNLDSTSSNSFLFKVWDQDTPNKTRDDFLGIATDASDRFIPNASGVFALTKHIFEHDHIDLWDPLGIPL